MNYAEPGHHIVDVAKGVLEGAAGSYQKHLTDMAGIYACQKSFKAAVDQRGNELVYEVTDQRPQSSHGDLIFGVTRMVPGRIGDEFYLTRGHIHAIANRPETYYCESGTGVMLLESPHGDTRAIEIKTRALCYVPPYWIHRSVNVGTDPLVMSFCYSADSGQDYSVIGRSAGMKQLIVANGTGWQAIPNPQYRPRSNEEIEALLNTADAKP